MAFNCPECGFELPGTPERTEDCFFCGWKPPRNSEPTTTPSDSGLEDAVIRITPNGSCSEGGYSEARTIINERHRNESYRSMARKGGLKKSKIPSMAAALSHVARGGENRPAVLVFLGLEEPTKPAPVCTNPDCTGFGEPHVFDCQTQAIIEKPLTPAPKASRPSRNRRPYKNFDPTDPGQVQRQIEKYMPEWELVKKERT